MIEIQPVQAFHPDSINHLVSESQQEGFQFLKRLVDDWTDGKNRFDQQGEALFIVTENNHIIGIGGLNIDPYQKDKQVGRLRHFYVQVDQRRNGVGQRLLKAILNHAKFNFDRVNLRTMTSNASAFYLSQGFKQAEQEASLTHFIELKTV